ncbi:hypothetical protein VFPPC_17970 [Pochonia chlamydosporia 170]|uniref:Uncharacterized protein n=1 Tax=Pochonia chlamydosporia 170 TaxID=1380566 RepID=A0A219APU6_METCM|nr:hypothetical protein VFPPC_17970 [Pochonia chlamydosporia 170]OWT42837.1 hypothetical protein VFPPC_17970 [Pochonia chlamydosporia 170]
MHMVMKHFAGTVKALTRTAGVLRTHDGTAFVFAKYSVNVAQGRFFFHATGASERRRTMQKQNYRPGDESRCATHNMWLHAQVLKPTIIDG